MSKAKTKPPQRSTAFTESIQVSVRKHCERIEQMIVGMEGITKKRRNLLAYTSNVALLENMNWLIRNLPVHNSNDPKLAMAIEFCTQTRNVLIDYS